ncbi:small multi-drug export protein [Salibacterium aidingense]|uniref:small multi-drug export protein n=1 Tax=Salibacterium aidingense TaxID=384933 RepID=UPI0003FB53FE|nr:small multi-drug export protein [Salibacterium aidingense]
MLEYLLLAISALGMGYIPFFEIYLAIPAMMVAGMGPVSAVIWAGLGNFAGVPTILFFYDQLSKIPRFQNWLHRMEHNRFRAKIERYGGIMVLLTTVFVGVWAVAAICRSLGMSRRKLMLTTGVSIFVYSVLTAYSVQVGLDWFQS